MIHRWSDADASAAVASWGPAWGEALALRTYSARLLGRDPALVLHGGGNTSVKDLQRDLFGEEVPALFVKASGLDLAALEPEGHVGLALVELCRLRRLESLTDDEMVGALRRHLLSHGASNPSIEALVHAFLPPRFIDHTHADAVLALTHTAEGERHVRDALGPDVIVLPYETPGFPLAKASADAFHAPENAGARGMVWLRHGIVTWGDTARESYDAMIDLVSRAEEYLARRAVGLWVAAPDVSNNEARRRFVSVAPLLRGAVSPEVGGEDRTRRPMILRPLLRDDLRALLDRQGTRAFAVTPPLTADHLIRTKPLPLWVDAPAYDEPERLRAQLTEAVAGYAQAYAAYVARNGGRADVGGSAVDPLPRVILLPGLGAICAGTDARAADIACDITAQTLAAKALAAGLGRFEGLAEAQLFAMEHRGLQQAKLGTGPEPPLSGRVGVVTGAAGAIGSGICEGLLREGCHVAVTDLPGEGLDRVVEELSRAYPGRVVGVPLDVSEAVSVRRAFETVIGAWGGIDLGVVNAGLAHVASLADLSLEAFRRLERVNVEGTLLVLQALARHFAVQGRDLGGDVVLISTKNVFAPGAQFGAYSATKAAAHQLARIASLELAPLGVRVNMVAPDAVFSHGGRRSGLWQEVGPDRMRARGLDEQGLEDYYRSRNLLKSRVTAEHVARAVLFFATRQTPTTGATLPVDGGLPDATPR
ncbi:MAG: bifunctional aldolase/short-chain dehydrogenase [Deltaproteobacteria bacterium]|nr:bifunctional aldolase/short-chain dehydrogenase [Deltaproteobacteria bacterium]